MSKQSRRLKSVKLKITLKCDLACTYCYLHTNRQPEMSAAVFEKALQIMHDFYFENIKVNGGEPTIADNFVKYSQLLRKNFPNRKMVLGTHGQHVLNANIRDGLDCYNELYLSADDQHRNYDSLEAIIKEVIGRGQRVTVQVVREFISKERLIWLKKLSQRLGFALSANSAVSFDSNQPARNQVNGPSVPCFGKEIVIMPDGNIHRCCKKDLLGEPDSKLSALSVVEEIFGPPPEPYPYCQYCESYVPSQVPQLKEAL